jgi:glycosyltransferase involved in cell wall biosynthesis
LPKKVTYIISDIDRALAFEWIATHMDKQRIDLSFILLNPNDSALHRFLSDRKIVVQSILCRGKKDWFSAFFKLFSTLKKSKPEVVHCHLQQACILGLMAARLVGIKTRIYTRHHSSLHHFYFPKGVFWDKLFNKTATKIIAISQPVKQILIDWEKVSEKKIELIPHGFLLESFRTIDVNVISTLKQKYFVEKAKPIIGVISRFTEWKGVQYIIPAFQKLLNDFPNAVLMFFNANGDYENEIKTLLSSIPEKNYRTISYDPMIAFVYHFFDVFVHTPIDKFSEAFGQVYIEAMVAGVPIIATKSGIANDILIHLKNAWVVDYKNSEAIYQGMKEVLTNTSLSQEIIAHGKITADDFSLDKMIEALTNLYESN